MPVNTEWPGFALIIFACFIAFLLGYFYLWWMGMVPT